jgi:predicted Rossmann fold nucleotide-binding protein DprA/Smf involved in DNA uptake
MLNDREKVLAALGEKPMKIFDVMKRANISNQEVCQSLLLKMRDEGSIKFDIRKGVWSLS